MRKTQYSQPPSTYTNIVSAESYLSKISKTMILRINLILILIIDKIKCKQAGYRYLILLHFFRTEVEAFESTVTDWDLKRYFERI